MNNALSLRTPGLTETHLTEMLARPSERRSAFTDAKEEVNALGYITSETRQAISANGGDPTALERALLDGRL